MTDSNLWILFFSLFIVLLCIVLYTLLRTLTACLRRYCRIVKWGKCCCYVRMDWEAYRQERESLHRLRVLRQQHHANLIHLDQQISTFSQIPGVIPDYRPGNLGFIIVRPVRDDDDDAPQSIREKLTVEQRRRILERLLLCRPCSLDDTTTSKDVENTMVVEDVEAADCDKESTSTEANHTATLDNVDSMVRCGHAASPDPSPVDEEKGTPPFLVESSSSSDDAAEQQEAPSIAIPQHEEPVDDNTCAICLDPFQEGELINDSTDCQHVFHKECLLGWLDKHDVCPCCRRCMVTEQDIKRAMREEGIQVSATATTTQQDQEEHSNNQSGSA